MNSFTAVFGRVFSFLIGLKLSRHSRRQPCFPSLLFVGKLALETGPYWPAKGPLDL